MKTNTSLYQELVEDFKEQNKLIDEQINVFEPLTASLRKPAAQRLLNKGSLAIFEIIFYCLFIGSIVFAFMLKHLVPFYILNQLKERGAQSGFPVSDVNTLYWSIVAMAVLLGIVFLYIARLLRKIRLKNAIIYTVNKHIKVLLQEHLKRKNKIDDIEKKYFTELPSLEQDKIDVNDVPNPGY